jgi:hypothetical protein
MLEQAQNNAGFLAALALFPLALATLIGLLAARFAPRLVAEPIDPCQRCGYDLDGLDDPESCPVCPECGHSRRTDPHPILTAQPSSSRFHTQ